MVERVMEIENTIRQIAYRESKIGYIMTGSYILKQQEAQDIDFVTYADVDERDMLFWKLNNDGWEKCLKDEYDDNRFFAFRKGDYNLIVCKSEYDYQSWVLATEVLKNCPHLYGDKADRVAMFETIRSVRENW